MLLQILGPSTKRIENMFCFFFFASHLLAAGTRVHDASQKDPRKLVTDLRPAASIRFFAITGKSLAGTARMWSAMYNRRPRLSRSTLDVAMPGSIKHRPRYFDATVSFNTLLRCRASTSVHKEKINKIRRFFLFFNFFNDVQHRRFVCCIAELLLGTNRTEQGNGMICFMGRGCGWNTGPMPMFFFSGPVLFEPQKSRGVLY